MNPELKVCQVLCLSRNMLVTLLYSRFVIVQLEIVQQISAIHLFKYNVYVVIFRENLS